MSFWRPPNPERPPKRCAAPGCERPGYYYTVKYDADVCLAHLPTSEIPPRWIERHERDA